jgi:hypothetical protein
MRPAATPAARPDETRTPANGPAVAATSGNMDRGPAVADAAGAADSYRDRHMVPRCARQALCAAQGARRRVIAIPLTVGIPLIVGIAVALAVAFAITVGGSQSGTA